MEPRRLRGENLDTIPQNQYVVRGSYGVGYEQEQERVKSMSEFTQLYAPKITNWINLTNRFPPSEQS